MPSTTAWYVVILLVAAGVTAAATLPARSLALKVGYVDMPDERKMHSRVTAYGGGGAMFVGVCIAMIAAALIPSIHAVFVGSNEAVGVLIAAAARRRAPRQPAALRREQQPRAGRGS